VRDVSWLFPVSMLAKTLGLAELVLPSLVFRYEMAQDGKLSGLPKCFLSALRKQRAQPPSPNHVKTRRICCSHLEGKPPMPKAALAGPVPRCRLAALLAQGSGSL